MPHHKMNNQNTKDTNSKSFNVFTKLDLSSIFENTTDSVWAINSSYEIIYTNNVFASAFYENFGIRLILGTNLLFSLPEPIRQDWKIRYDRALNNESFSFIDNLNTEQGSLYIEVFMNPINFENKIIGAIFFGKDITKRKLDEKALLDSQLLLKASLESHIDTILFSIDKNYHYLYFNLAHAKSMKYAYNIEIQVGMNILDCIGLDKDRIMAKENYDRALSGERHSEIRLYGNKNIAYYESFFNPIFNDHNEIIGASGLARDITERKKSEMTLLQNERELKELNSTKDKLFSIIAHDLRSPFNNIIGFTQLLLENINDITLSETKKHLNIIYSSANSTLNLLDNLLNWAKSQTGKIRFHPKKIIFSDIITDVLNLERSIAKAKDITLNQYIPKYIEVYADENMLKIIVRNLISNAIKFTNKGGLISISAMIKKDFAEIVITDNGIGISKKKCRQLFAISSNKSTQGTENEKGSGLGLILCKEFIKKIGGRIWVESEEGKGSNFKFTLPIYEPINDIEKL
jgi:signal transduction histidine kinase